MRIKPLWSARSKWLCGTCFSNMSNHVESPAAATGLDVMGNQLINKCAWGISTCKKRKDNYFNHLHLIPILGFEVHSRTFLCISAKRHGRTQNICQLAWQFWHRAMSKTAWIICHGSSPFRVFVHQETLPLPRSLRYDFHVQRKAVEGVWEAKKTSEADLRGLRARLAGTHVLRLKIAIFLEGGCPPWPSHVVINSWPHLSWGYKAWALHEPRKNLRYCLKVSLNFCPDAGQSRSPLAGL